MKTKFIVIGTAFTLVFVLASKNLRAEEDGKNTGAEKTGKNIGTFIVGAKVWGAFWDPAVSKLSKLEALLTSIVTSSLVPTITSFRLKRIGKGVMGGPALGYQAPDGKWSINVSAMWFSIFDAQASEMSILGLGTPRVWYPVKKNIRYKFERSEVDLVPRYSINQNWKIFLGYKFQWQKTAFGGIKISNMYHSISPGAGFYLPFANYFVFGLQGGVLCVIPNFSKSGQTYRSAKNVNLGINGEVSIGVLIARHFIIQVGYRAQVIWVDFIGNYVKIHTSDFFHGITVTLAGSF